MSWVWTRLDPRMQMGINKDPKKDLNKNGPESQHNIDISYTRIKIKIKKNEPRGLDILNSINFVLKIKQKSGLETQLKFILKREKIQCSLDTTFNIK